MFARELWQRFALATFVAAAGPSALAQVEPTLTAAVDCDRGGSIARALTLGDERKPIVVVVSGTCTGPVSIERSDVTLMAGPGGGGVAGADPVVDAVSVTGSRATIDGLVITGGRNGIRAIGAAGLVVRNTTVSGTGRSGLSLGEGTSAHLDRCTIQDNPRDGVAIEAAHAVILGSLVTRNGRIGVAVVDGGSARIGIDGQNVPSGSTITENGASGVVATLGGAIYVAMSEISGNGTDPGSLVGRVGIAVAGGSANLIGGNTVANNRGTGVNTSRGGNVTIGDPSFGLTTVNTITGNGSVGGSGGVFGFMGSAVQVRDAIITGNTGFGLGLSLKSHGQIGSSRIQGNVGDGIRLLMGSGLFPFFPAPPASVVVSDNTAWGLNCQDGESSVVNLSLLAFSGNGLGSVAATCTAF